MDAMIASYISINIWMLFTSFVFLIVFITYSVFHRNVIFLFNYWCVLAAEVCACVCLSLCCSVSWLSRSPGLLLLLHFLLLLRLLLGDFSGLLEWPSRMTAARLAAESRWTNGVSCPNGGKDGSWQSDHHGGRVQLQPHAGLHTLQHQPEPLPTSSCPHVSICMHTHQLRVCELNQTGFIFFLSLNLEQIKHLKGDFTLGHIFIFLAALDDAPRKQRLAFQEPMRTWLEAKSVIIL